MWTATQRMMVLSSLRKGTQKETRVYLSVCAHCMCIGGGVEQGGIKGVVSESLTSKSLCFG